MRDVLGTIQADQDAIIRAGSRGALVVDGGPGTGKTVVALHRAAYLLYADPRLGHRRGGVLFVGPHRPYLAYVSDVLAQPRRGGRADLHPARPRPRGRHARCAETDPEVARLKSSAAMVDGDRAGRAVLRGAADRGHGGRDAVGRPLGRAPTTGPTRSARRHPGTPHNEARDQVWDGAARRSWRTSTRPTRTSPSRPGAPRARPRRNRDWPRPSTGPGRWSRRPTSSATCGRCRRTCACAPRGSSARGGPLLQREDAAGLDRRRPAAARRRPTAARRPRRRPGAGAGTRRPSPPSASRWPGSSTTWSPTDDSEHAGDAQLRAAGPARRTRRRRAAPPAAEPDLLAGPFAHVVVDEAQELTDAEWQMLLLRCPSRSFTVVGDRAQARHGFTESVAGPARAGRARPGRRWPR